MTEDCARSLWTNAAYETEHDGDRAKLSKSMM